MPACWMKCLESSTLYIRRKYKVTRISSSSTVNKELWIKISIKWLFMRLTTTDTSNLLAPGGRIEHTESQNLNKHFVPSSPVLSVSWIVPTPRTQHHPSQKMDLMGNAVLEMSMHVEQKPRTNKIKLTKCRRNAKPHWIYRTALLSRSWVMKSPLTSVLLPLWMYSEPGEEKEKVEAAKTEKTQTSVQK